MNKLVIAVIGLMLVTPTTGWGQERTDAEFEEMLSAFSRRAESDQLSIQVVHLNDVTTDALFEAPAKYSLRAQARGATMFFVQGTVKQDGYNVDMEWVVVLANRSVRAQTVSISNFEPGTEFKAGDQFSGIIALEELVNLREKFTLTNLNWKFEFLFPSSVIRQLEAAD